MDRVFLFIAGCLAGYIASGYIEGLLEGGDDATLRTSSTQNAEKV